MTHVRRENADGALGFGSSEATRWFSVSFMYQQGLVSRITRVLSLPGSGNMFAAVFAKVTKKEAGGGGGVASVSCL